MQLRVVRGAPTDEELAAIVSVLLAHQSTAPPARGAAAVSRWARSARPGVPTADGGPARAGPGAWRASALPR